MDVPPDKQREFEIVDKTPRIQAASSSLLRDFPAARLCRSTWLTGPAQVAPRGHLVIGRVRAFAYK
jgi:hypothetical protein